MFGFPPIWLVHHRTSLPGQYPSSQLCSIAEKINNVKAKIQGNPSNASSSLAKVRGHQPYILIILSYDLDSIPLDQERLIFAGNLK